MSLLGSPYPVVGKDNQMRRPLPFGGPQSIDLLVQQCPIRFNAEMFPPVVFSEEVLIRTRFIGLWAMGCGVVRYTRKGVTSAAADKGRARVPRRSRPSKLLSKRCLSGVISKVRTSEWNFSLFVLPMASRRSYQSHSPGRSRNTHGYRPRDSASLARNRKNARTTGRRKAQA